MKLVFLLILLFPSSLLSLEAEDEAKLSYYFNIGSSMRFNELYDWKEGFVIKKPFHAKVPLIEIKNPQHLYCLFYKVPAKEETQATLGLVQMDLGSSCFESLKGSEVFKTSFSFERSRDIVFKKVVLESRIELYLMTKKPLMIKRSLLPRKFKLYSSYLPEDPMEGVDFLGKLSPKKSLGEYGDNYRDQSAIACRVIAKDCSIIRDDCERCRYGSFEVLKTGCQKDVVFCGRDQCGLNGFPACTRYKPASRFSSKGPFPCELLKEFSMCRKGLEPTCDGNGVVICL